MKAIFIGLKCALLNYIDFNVGIAVGVDIIKTKNKKDIHFALLLVAVFDKIASKGFVRNSNLKMCFVLFKCLVYSNVKTI